MNYLFVVSEIVQTLPMGNIGLTLAERLYAYNDTPRNIGINTE